MSALASGDYYIVSNTTTSSGIHLAANFNGNNTAVNVVNFRYLPAQVWKIANYSDFPNMYSISPTTSSSLLIGMGDGGIETIEASSTYTWYIDEFEGVYIISDSTQLNFWDLENHDATEGAEVIIDANISDVTQNWRLIPVHG